MKNNGGKFFVFLFFMGWWMVLLLPSSGCSDECSKLVETKTEEPSEIAETKTEEPSEIAETKTEEPSEIAEVKAGECSKIVEAEGLAPVINEDVEMARQMAILEAKRTAVEPLGVQIDSETLISMGLTRADWITIKAGGYVKHYEVLPGSGPLNNGYRVKIRAWVKCGREEKDEDINLLSLHKIMVIAEGPGSGHMEQGLLRELSSLNYRYHDSRYVKNNVKPVTWNRLTAGKLFDLDRDAFKFMADLIIRVQSKVTFRKHDGNLPGSWFRGEGSIQLYRISGEKKGEPLIHVRRTSNKLFGLGNGDEKQATDDVLTTEHPNGFVRKIADPLVSEFMKKLMANNVFKVREREITVTLANVPSRNEFMKFLTVINSQRGVNQSARELRQDGRDYTVSVKFPLKTIYLAYLLSATPGYRLTGHQWNRVDLIYTGGS
jgi:hypothetical protein